jgi:hypothetical protein
VVLLSFGWMRELDIRFNKYFGGSLPGVPGLKPYAW